MFTSLSVIFTIALQMCCVSKLSNLLTHHILTIQRKIKERSSITQISFILSCKLIIHLHCAGMYQFLSTSYESIMNVQFRLHVLWFPKHHYMCNKHLKVPWKTAFLRLLSQAWKTRFQMGLHVVVLKDRFKIFC